MKPKKPVPEPLRFYRWRVRGDKFVTIDIIAPNDIGEVILLATRLHPGSKIDFVELKESIDAIWTAPLREPTIEEQARAEVEALVGP